MLSEIQKSIHAKTDELQKVFTVHIGNMPTITINGHGEKCDFSFYAQGEEAEQILYDSRNSFMDEERSVLFYLDSAGALS